MCYKWVRRVLCCCPLGRPGGDMAGDTVMAGALGLGASHLLQHFLFTQEHTTNIITFLYGLWHERTGKLWAKESLLQFLHNSMSTTYQYFSSIRLGSSNLYVLYFSHTKLLLLQYSKFVHTSSLHMQNFLSVRLFLFCSSHLDSYCSSQFTSKVICVNSSLRDLCHAGAPSRFGPRALTTM